jgi:hypothetical protein
MKEMDSNSLWERYEDLKKEKWYKFVYDASVVLEIFVDRGKINTELLQHIRGLRDLIHWGPRLGEINIIQILDALNELINKLEASQSPRTYQLALDMRNTIIQANILEDPST